VGDAELGVPACGAVSPDGGVTAVGNKAGELHLLPEGGRPGAPWVLPGRVSAAAFSQTGRHLAAAHADGSLAVYRLP
jgi:hypothetical protein